MTAETLIGAAAAVLGTIGWLPQTYRAWRTRETKDLSLPANLMLLATIGLWLTYGLLLASWPLIAANIISGLLVGAIIVAKLRFG